MDVRLTVRPSFNWHLFCLWLFMSLVTVVRVGNFEVRLANFYADDTLVFYSYLYAMPERFAGDIFLTLGPAWTFATIVHWLPVLLLQTLKFPPEVMAWVFVYLQNVLLGFALFFYGRAVTGRNDVAWLTVLFAYAAQPWSWNLTNYSNGMEVPYARHVVMPFLIFAGVATVKKRPEIVTCLLILSALIHPSLTLWMAAIAGRYWADQYPLKKGSSLLKRFLLLGCVAVVCLTPWLLTVSTVSQVNDSDLIEIVAGNLHMNPFLTKNFWFNAGPTFVAFMILALLALRYQKNLNQRFVSFWLASVSVTVILSLLHIVGLVMGLPWVLQAVPLRSTVLLVMFSLPLVMFYLTQKLETNRWLVLWMAGSLVLFQARFKYGAFWGPLLGLLLWELSERHLAISRIKTSQYPVAAWFRWASPTVFILWNAMILASGSTAVLKGPSSTSFEPILSTLIGGSFFNPGGYFSCLLGGVMIAFFGKRRFQQKPALNPIKILALGLIGIIGVNVFEEGAKTRGVLWRSNYEAQLWVRQNTPQNAKFLVLTGLGWRTVAVRPALFFPPEGLPIHYTGSRLTQQSLDQWDEFFENERIFPEAVLDQEQILRMAGRFGGNYVVRSLVDYPRAARVGFLNLPVVYQNSAIAIHKIGD